MSEVKKRKNKKDPSSTASSQAAPVANNTKTPNKNAALRSMIQSANLGVPEEKRTIGQMIRHPDNRNVIRKLVTATLAMLILPIVTYFSLSDNLPLWFESVDRNTAQTGGIIGAVIMANLVIGAYVISAFQGD